MENKKFEGKSPDSKMLIFVAAVLACAAAGGGWSVEVGVNAITKGKGPVPGHYDMISTKVSGAGVWVWVEVVR